MRLKRSVPFDANNSTVITSYSIHYTKLYDTTHTQARYVLPRVIGAFRERYPEVTLDLHQGTSEQIADMVAANEIDFAIATGSRELFADLLLVPSYRWDRKILVPKDHPLTKLKRRLTLHDLGEYPLVTYVFSFGSYNFV